MLVCIVAATRAGADCVDYAGALRWLGAPTEWVNGVDLRMDGEFAFIASEGYGINFVDFSDPTNPILLGAVDTPGYAQAIDLQSGILAVADGYSGLRLMDVVEPDHPRFLSVLELPGVSLDVAIRGDYAYVCTSNSSQSGIHIVDLSLPMSPVHVGLFEPTSSCRLVTFSGDLMIVGTSSGIIVADVTDPLAPVVLGSRNSPWSLQSVTVVDSTVFCTFGPDGAWIIDISDPQSPDVVYRFHPSNTCLIGVTVRDDIAFVGDYWGGTMVVDISYLPSPEIIAEVPNSNGDRVLIYRDGLLYTASGSGGVDVYDVSSLTSYDITDQLSIPGTFGNDIEIDGDLAYIASNGGISVADISNPSSLTTAGSLWLDRDVTAIEYMDGFLYCGSYDLKVVDVTNPNEPQLGAQLDINLGADGLLVVDHQLFASTGFLYVFDVFDPRKPTYLDYVSIGAHAFDQKEQDGLLYVSGLGGSLTILELQGDHGTMLPRRIGQVSTEGRGAGLDVVGNVAYLTVDFHGLYIIDVSTPENPVILSIIDPPGYESDVAVRDGVAYVASSLGFVAIDVSDPAHPFVIGGIATDDDVEAIAIGPESLILLTHGSGILSAPFQCPSASPPSIESPSEESRVTSVFPNPFNPVTSVKIRCRNAEAIELTVFDLKGRRIATLAEGEFAAGEHVFEWRGRDTCGRAVAAGTYLMRLRTPDGVECNKITLAK
ncbi:MAG: FlgD immunoglobulin-like domain containing protein [Candidatus Krumholzibacteriia bacterium]